MRAESAMPGRETRGKTPLPKSPRRNPACVAITSHMLSEAEESTASARIESAPAAGGAKVSTRQVWFQAQVIRGTAVSRPVGKAEIATLLPVKRPGSFSGAKVMAAKPRRPKPRITVSRHTARAVNPAPRA
jgi:hypothetical protein